MTPAMTIRTQVRRSRCGAWVLLCLCMVLTALTITTANAEKKSTVLVVRTGVESRAATALLWHVRQVINGRSGLQGVQLTSLLDGQPNQSLSAARRALRRGRSAVEEFELNSAPESLLLASTVFSGWAHEGAAATEALALLGQTYATLGKPRKRNKIWRRLLQIRPDFRFKNDDVSPSIRRSLDAVRENLRRYARGMVRIRAKKNRPACAVFLDGRFRGLTPLRLSDVSGGLHHLRLSADGYQHVYQLVKVDGQRTQTVNCRTIPAERRELFERVMSRAPRDLRSPNPILFLDELKALSASEHAILVTIADGEIQGVLYDFGRRKLASQASFPFRGQNLERAASTLVDMLYRDIEVHIPSAPLAASFPQRDDSGSTGAPPRRDWLLWSAVTVGIAAAVVIPWLLWPDDDEGLKKNPNTGAVIVRF